MHYWYDKRVIKDECRDSKGTHDLDVGRNNRCQCPQPQPDMSAIADAAIQEAVRQARREEWKQEHADALAAQDDWQDQHGHPFRAIMAGPFSGAGQS